VTDAPAFSSSIPRRRRRSSSSGLPCGRMPRQYRARHQMSITYAHVNNTSFRPKKVACSVVEHPIVGEADRPIMRKLVADIASTVNQSPHGGISAEIQRDPVKVSEESPRRREWVVLDLLVFLFGLRPLPAERPVSSPDIRQTLANT